MANFSTKIASTVTASALVASAMSTSLVSAASEFLPYAEALATNKVIGTQATEAGYRLNDQITRAELAKVAANLGQYTAVSCTGKVFADVNKSLGDLCDAIETLAAAKVITTTNANFRPAANVTRAEMVKMLLGAVGEKPSANDAGYKDVTSSLGDLAGFINRANELKCANTATYFRPAANSSRGEAFKIASCTAGLKVNTTTTTGSTTTGTIVNTGNLTLTTVGTPAAQYVPLNASSVKVGTVKVTATGGDATVSTITIARSGLGEVAGLRASLAQNGVVVGNARTFNNTSQEVVIRLNTPVTLKSGSSIDLDVLASLPENGTSNSQHQFTASAVNGSAITPVTLGLINTTSYAVSTVEASALTAETVKSGLAAARIANLKVTAPSGRDVTVNGFTVSKTTGNDLTQAIANVKVFRNGVDTGAKATVMSDKIVVTGLATKLASGDTANYELRADTIYVGEATTYKLYIANTEDISATENTTGYATRTKITAGEATLGISGIKVTTTLVDTTTKTVAPGTSAVNLLDGKISSTASFEVRGFNLQPQVNGAAATLDQLKAIFSSLSFDVAGTNYDLLAGTLSNGAYTYGNGDVFNLDAGTDALVRVRGTVKSNVDTNAYKNVKFVFNITQLKNIDNGNTFAFSKDLAGNVISLKSSTLDVRGATVAAPSTRNIASSVNGVEIGRFGLESKNADARVAKITVTNAATSSGLTTLTALADNASSFRLVDLSTGTEVDASKEFSSDNKSIEFSFSPAITVNKDTIKNYKLTVDTKSIAAENMGKNFAAKFTVAANDLSTDNGSVSFVTADETGVTYNTSISLPTITVAKTTLDANSPVGVITVKNNDSDNYVQVKKMKIRVQARSTANGSVDFSTAKVCLRNQGSTVACGDAATIASTAGAVNGAVLEFDVTDAINAGKVISTNSSTDFEVYLQNAPLWVAGDYVGVSVEGADYSYGNTTAVGTTATDTYVGVAGASATSTK